MSENESTAVRVGKILKLLRQKHDLSQLDLSLQAEISPRHYQEIEYGKKNCQIDTLNKILGVYGIGPLSFFHSYLLDYYREQGVGPLYELFGPRAFGIRRFDLEGTVTFQCDMSEEITGMRFEEVKGKMKLWSDLQDSALASFLQISMKIFIQLRPPLPSWQVQIKNHRTGTVKPYMGFGRYLHTATGELEGFEALLFPC